MKDAICWLGGDGAVQRLGSEPGAPGHSYFEFWQPSVLTFFQDLSSILREPSHRQWKERSVFPSSIFRLQEAPGAPLEIF